MMKRIFATIVLCTLTVAVTPLLAATYDHQVEAKGVTFSWKIDGDTMHAKMSAKTKGWVAVGFNPSEKMKGANFIIGFVKNGKAEIADHYGKSAVAHAADTKNDGSEDVTLVGGSEEKGITTIEFTMPIKSSDQNDSVLSTDGDTVVLLAYAIRDSFKARHKGKPGIITVNLATGAVK